mgnify:CR=1 FL=1
MRLLHAVDVESEKVVDAGLQSGFVGFAQVAVHRTVAERSTFGGFDKNKFGARRTGFCKVDIAVVGRNVDA